jgi:hypothetical protein
MQKVTPGWKTCQCHSCLVVIGLWTKQTASVSLPMTVGTAAPVQSAAISPMEIMIRREPDAPAADPVEPF